MASQSSETSVIRQLNRRRESEILKHFASPDFNAENYALGLATQVKAVTELKTQKTKLQVYVEHTSSAMKKNVYRNYSLFIEAHKEVQNLEAEAYDLKSFFNEEKQIMSQLQAVSLNNFSYDDTKSKALDMKNLEKIAHMLSYISG
eukprot:Sdes_comp15807_c0_seq1m4879